MRTVPPDVATGGVPPTLRAALRPQQGNPFPQPPWRARACSLHSCTRAAVGTVPRDVATGWHKPTLSAALSQQQGDPPPQLPWRARAWRRKEHTTRGNSKSAQLTQPRQGCSRTVPQEAAGTVYYQRVQTLSLHAVRVSLAYIQICTDSDVYRTIGSTVDNMYM